MLADEFLKSKGIDFQLIKQKRATYRCIDSADERGVSTKQIVKSMVVKSGGKIVQCLIPGHLELDDGKLSSLLGKPEMASEEEVKNATGQAVGTVHPYVGVTRKLIDERLLENETLSFTTGNPMEGVIIDRDGFLRAFGRYEVVDICSDPEEYLENLASKHGIQKHDAKFLVESESLGYFEKVVGAVGSGGAMEWLRNLIRFADSRGKSIEVVRPEWFVQLVKADLTEFARKELFIKTLESVVLPQIRREAMDLDSIIERVIEENKVQAEQYRRGDQKVLNFLIGQAMKASRGAFDPKDVRGKLLEKLGQPRLE